MGPNDVYPETDGFREDTFSLNSHRSIQTYNFATGARIETEAEQAADDQLPARVESKAE